MNQNPRSGRQRPQGSHPNQPQHAQNRPPLTPQQIAARRAYIARRKREIRRNRIILGVSCVVVLAVLILLISLIVRGISSVVSDGGAQTDSSAVHTGVPDDIFDTGHSEGTSGTDRPVQTDVQTQSPVVAEKDLSYDAMAFVSDLKDYEKYMNPTEERDDYLVLVNAGNPLTQNDNPTDLVDVVNTRKDGREAQKMRKTAARALEALYIEAQAQGMMTPDTPSGYPLSVTSGYRSYATQNYLFTTYTQNELNEHPGWTKEQAEAEVMTYSCRPGTSEHQTGLSCDMHTLSGADVSFANYEQAAWLAENCWKFGFILRFPKDKVNETGISYEPWHFRYVGRYHAYRIWSLGLCLEEYVEQLKNS